jgi:hypothetical protein
MAPNQQPSHKATYSLQFVLDQEGNNMGELNSFFFAVGKARDALSFHQRPVNGKLRRPACRSFRRTRSMPIDLAAMEK